MAFQYQIKDRLESLNKFLQDRILFKDFVPLSEDDFKNYLTGNCFDTIEFIFYLADEYTNNQTVENAINEFGHEGLVKKYQNLQSDVCAQARGAVPADDEGLVKGIIELGLRLCLEDLEEIAAYVYLCNPDKAAVFEKFSEDNLEDYINEFIRTHSEDNPIVFEFDPSGVRETLTLEEFEELLSREGWEKTTKHEERDRYEQDGHDRTFGFVWNECKLKGYEIEYSQSYTYYDFESESFHYGNNGNEANVRTNFDVEDHGHRLSSAEIEKILDGYGFFTEFQDQDFYERLN